MTVTVTDLFCGAGGSSIGASAAGLELSLAMNHWSTAIEVHQAHFPDAAHDCADISQADPRRYPRTDVLLASPECTNHSQARGVSRKRQQAELWDAPDPAAERSRATMWDVPRFSEQMRYDAIIVENVTEATKWVGWRGWCVTMEDLGYDRKIVSHNSMHHGVPQSRDRIYVVFTRKGIVVDLELELQTWCPTCQANTMARQAWKNGRTVGRYRQQYVWNCTTCHGNVEPAWTPASSIIDWTLDTPKIGQRTRPLSANTRARILAGLQRYGWAEPIITAGAGNTYETTPGNRARSLSEPMATQQTASTHALAEPPDSLVVNLRGTSAGQIATTTRPTTEPLGTVAAGGNHQGLLMRNNKGGAEMVTPLTEPARTMTTAGHQSLLVPADVDVERLVDECGFRMLEPHEVAAAMAFPDGYIPTDLTKKDRVKLAGNAVTPPVMQWLCGRVLQGLAA